jgi:hypothetical protein
MNLRDFWMAVFLAACRAGLTAEHAAQKADKAIKELKTRDDDGWWTVGD